MKARVYHENGDSEVFVIWDDSGKRTTENNNFIFTGFSNKLHPYYKKKWNWVKLILATKAFILHHTIVPTVADMVISGKEYEDITIDRVKLPPMESEIQKKNLQSSDGNIYVVVMDEEMGRGWAVFVVIKPDGTKEILQDGHRDSVLDWFMDGEFFKSKGIDYERKELADLNNIPADAESA